MQISWNELRREKLWSTGIFCSAWKRNLHTVGRMVQYYFALAYKMVKMSKSAFLLQMEVSLSEKLS